AGLTIHVGQALFPRIDADRQRTLLDVWLPQTVAPGKTPAAKTGPEKSAPAKSAPAKAPPANGARVSFDEVQKIELRVAVVLSAEAIPKTKKLLKLTVDAGEDQPRQVVAGIAEAFSAADIVGHKVILVANLQPAEIRGVKSEGMILAAGDRTISGLATVDRDVPAGTPIR
ncbi:MAG TPA: methionine--tRNA ligase subunit beta, partial [Kofleriaceae bacterium]|nr:methionine--tRNA ligase subunit beta [Kofleriaceae bacterium]